MRKLSVSGLLALAGCGSAPAAAPAQPHHHVSIVQIGAPVLRAAYYRHWPRNFFVTTADASHMQR